MTEDEWLDDGLIAQHLLDHLLKPGKLHRTKAGKRRLRLFACACCRDLWHLLDDPILRQVVETTERFAEGDIARAELDVLLPAVQSVIHTIDDSDAPGADRRTAAGVALSATMETAGSAAWHMTATPIPLPGSGRKPLVNDADVRRLLCEVFGNPFRPVAVERRWKTRTTVSLAQAAYDERLLPSGHLDPARLGVLSDALEEAGATGEVLAHLRSAGPHVRGCWALDLILGKG